MPFLVVLRELKPYVVGFFPLEVHSIVGMCPLRAFVCFADGMCPHSDMQVYEFLSSELTCGWSPGSLLLRDSFHILMLGCASTREITLLTGYPPHEGIAPLLGLLPRWRYWIVCRVGDLTRDKHIQHVAGISPTSNQFLHVPSNYGDMRGQVYLRGFPCFDYPLKDLLTTRILGMI